MPPVATQADEPGQVPATVIDRSRRKRGSNEEAQTDVITLVLGGARSGKSAVAERLAAEAGDDVVYVATAEAVEGDADFAARIETHRARRPPSWSTVESGPDLPATLRSIPAGQKLLVDSLGTWVARCAEFSADGDALAAALEPHDAVVVSEEVGLGVHPETEVGRRWRDAIGEVNQAVAVSADRVVLVVAGRILEL
jgi:adenosyl cobinamide kinase/adenosyl cobinamide phosphate guanylyltransferase